MKKFSLVRAVKKGDSIKTVRIVFVAAAFLIGLCSAPAFAVQLLDGQANIIVFTGDAWSSGSNDLMKINGKTGAVMWRKNFIQVFFAKILIDKKNDIVLYSTLDFPYLGKYSGSSGEKIWEFDTYGFFIVDVQIDKNGAIIMDTYLDDGRYLVKFDGVTGKDIWVRKTE